MSGVSPDDTAMVDALDEVWTRIAALGASLTEEEWKRPTEVPGWSVQDNMTHLTDLEAMILGRPAPEHTPPDGLAHVKNDPGVRNERYVDSRRAWSGADALAEFVEVTHARIAQLRSYSVEDFAADSWTPMGPGTVHDLLPFRVFDSWVHEQDMRRAVGQPGGLGGGAAEESMRRITGTAGYVIGKKAAAPDGTTVVIELAAPLAQTLADRRGRWSRPRARHGARRADGPHHDRRRDLRAPRVRTRRSRGRAGRGIGAHRRRRGARRPHRRRAELLVLRFYARSAVRTGVAGA